MKVLLIYPNCEGYGRIPLGLSILSACLKKHGHEVRLFDLTFIVSKNVDNEMREKIGTAKKTDTLKYWGKPPKTDIEKAILKEIEEFKPQLIGISIIQNNYWVSVDLLKVIKKVCNTHVVAGGTFASVAPGILLNTKLVDSVIVGEGEEAIVELAAALESNKEIDLIRNITFLRNGRLHYNPVRSYVNLNKIPFQDLSLFDERHFLKPFDGNMRRAGYFELTRGCPFSCAYCANYFLNRKLYCHERVHVRFKDINRSIEEISSLKDKYKFEFIFFADENMIVLPYTHLKKYAQLWNKYVRLPFYITTRAEMVTEDKIKVLKDMNCATVAFGIECGNENFRRKTLKRFNTNEQIIKAFRLCSTYNIRTTANNMFGFPYETEALIFDTIKLNMTAKPDSFSISIFAPYLGTELHKICVKEGYITEGIPRKISIIDESILRMPYLPKERIKYLYSNFVKYVSGKNKIPARYQ